MSKSTSPEKLRQELITLLSHFETGLHQDDLRSKVLRLAEAFSKLRHLGIALLPSHGFATGAARDRILLYFQKYVGEIIQGDELAVVAGIQDYPRRIRELRVQFGWPIYTGLTIRQMLETGDIFIEKPTKIDTDSYLLLRNEVDKQSAYRWHLANSLRKGPGGGKEKILHYLKENVQTPVAGEELRYVAKDSSEWARRVRELRTEDGWLIRTKSTGRPDLPMGMYILEDLRQLPVHDRRIPDPVQVEVLKRDCFRCLCCGWSREVSTPDDPRHLLELHHIKHHSKRGSNLAENLATLCNICHDEVHRIDKSGDWSKENFNEWLRNNKK